MAGQFGVKIKILLILILCWLIVSCATSNVSRDASANVDAGILNLEGMGDNVSETMVGDAYQNASQSIKGGLIGGAVGAVAGSMSSMGILPVTAVGAILGASYGAYIDTNTNLHDQLENRGVKIIILGDQVMVVIPSERLFDPLTAHIKTQSYGTLEMVAQYINRFNKTLVKVSAYTTQTNSRLADQALSEQQANAVEKFLMVSGIDARLLYAQGYGGSNLVQENQMSWYGNDNYRIQITFEKLYA